ARATGWAAIAAIAGRKRPAGDDGSDAPASANRCAAGCKHCCGGGPTDAVDCRCGPNRGPGTQLRRAGCDASRDAGTVNAEAEERECRERQGQHIVHGRWLPPNPWVNWLNRLVPMPTMTASTRILTPDAMMLPRTRSARNAVLPNRPNGTRTKPAR